MQVTMLLDKDYCDLRRVMGHPEGEIPASFEEWFALEYPGGNIQWP